MRNGSTMEHDFDPDVDRLDGTIRERYRVEDAKKFRDLKLMMSVMIRMSSRSELRPGLATENGSHPLQVTNTLSPHNQFLLACLPRVMESQSPSMTMTLNSAKHNGALVTIG
jgi:hypothetical protein